MTKYDSLVFNAAGAFVSLPRPGQSNAEQLDALAMPLFDQLSVEGKRRIAAVLSECREVIPSQLVEALILQSLDISASLLISRAQIPDHLLEKAISICGEAHARVVLLRSNISVSVKNRIDALIDSIVPSVNIESKPMENIDKPASMPKSSSNAQTQLEAAQDRLRNMMMRQTLPERQNPAEVKAFNHTSETNIVARLINLALEGDTDFLCTALADEWSVPFSKIKPLVKRNNLRDLSLLLKGLEFGATDTFAIVSAFNPGAFSNREAIASFYLKFQAISVKDIGSFTSGFTENNTVPDSQAVKAA